MPTEIVMARQAINSPAFATPYVPDPEREAFVIVTLTGNLTVSNPASARPGAKLVFEFIQDGTGTRTVTFGSAYKVTWTPTTTAGLRNVIEFICDGTNWLQMSTGIGLPA